MSFLAPHNKLGKTLCSTDQSCPHSATCPVLHRQPTCSAFRGARFSKLQFYTGHQLRPDSHNCLATRTSHITNSSSKEAAVLEPAARPSADLLEQQLVEGNLDRAPVTSSGLSTGAPEAPPALQNGISGPSCPSSRPMQTVLTSKALTDEGLMADVASMRVAYQGAPGAYSEGAAVAAYPDCTPIPCEQFEVAFQALSQWIADRAVLPIENSLGGSIHSVYDLLLRYRLSIVGEVSIEVNHCLLVSPGVQKKDVRRVISHYQALAQVENYVRKMAGVTREAVDDTAGAAKMVAQEGWRDVAAVASRRAAELYGLDVLEEGIQDDTANVTRFLILARDPLMVQPNSPIPHRTSIAFSMPEKPGQLFKALSCFAMRDIDLTKIESRPLKTNPIAFTPAGDRRFRYLFFIDAAANLADDNTQNALRHLQEMAGYLRVLGCYPCGKKKDRPVT